MRILLGFYLDSVAYFIFSGSLLFWMGRDHRKIIRILCVYFLIAGLIMLSANYFRLFNLKTNLQFYTVLCFVNAFGLGLYFSKILERKGKKVLVYLAIGINGFYYLWSNVINEPQAVFDSLGYVILSTSVVVMIFLYLHQLLTNIKEDPLSHNFDFWFVSSQLIYYLGAFAIFLTYGYLTRKAMNGNSDFKFSEALTWLWGIHNVLLFLSSLITLGGIIWISYHRKLPSS